MNVLFEKLGYQFNNTVLVEQALTHRSYAKPHNERLEFLGDAIVNCVISTFLFQQFPTKDEGDLTYYRSYLVKRDTLVIIAQAFNLGDYVQLGEGEIKSGGRIKPSILANTLEALVGAIYLDSSFDTCYKVVKHWYQTIVRMEELDLHFKDPKTRLQEYLQAGHLSLPNYVLISIEGTAQEPQFVVECTVSSLAKKAFGRGRNRKLAEQEAAEQMYMQLTALPEASN